MLERHNLLEQEPEDFGAIARAFFEKEVVPCHELWARDGIVDRELWRKAGQRGLLFVPYISSLGTDEHRSPPSPAPTTTTSLSAPRPW